MTKLTKTLLTLFLISPLLTLKAADIFVAPNGSDSNAGTISSPLRSLLAAVKRARPDDTVILRGGFHNVHEIYIDRKKRMGGRPGHYLTIKAYEGEEPVLRGSRRMIVWADYVRIEGLHFIMPWRLDAFGHGLQIINNRFTGPQPKYGAIEVGGKDILIEGNVIEFSEGGNTRDHGIYVHRGEGITIRNNRIFGTQGYGIHVYDEQKSSNQRDWATHPFVIKNYVLEGNVVAGSKSRSGIIVAKGRGAPFIKLENIIIRNNVLGGNTEFGLLIREGKDIKVYNNTFFMNRMASVLVREPSRESAEAASDIEIVNNIFVTPPGKVHVGNRSSGKNIILKNNLYDDGPELRNISDSNPVVGYPEFVSISEKDFHLKSDSPAVDKGLQVGLPFSGPAPDLGAFEYQPGNGGSKD